MKHNISKNINKKILNRKAEYNYKILEKFEFGVVLYGWEVKSLRHGNATICNAHLSYNAPHIVIHNMHIAAYEHEQKVRTAEETDRSRIMLVHKKEKNKIMAISKMPGQTVVPLELYWKKGKAKLLCAIVCGKTEYDKRHAIKDRDWQREKLSIIKNRQLAV